MLPGGFLAERGGFRSVVGRARFPYASCVFASGRQGRHLGAVLLAGLALASCGGGGGDEDSGEVATEGTVGGEQPFPSPESKSLAELRRGLGPGPRMVQSVSVLEPGSNRFAFALFDRTRRQISDTPAAVYVAPEDGGPVSGPYPARYRSLQVAAGRRSRTVEHDADAAQAIYVANVPFRRPGRYQVLGVAQLDQRVVGGDPVSVSVGRAKRPPAVGEAAPRVHTPTADDVGGDLSEIDTRDPPSSLHEDDLADVLGRRPVMLLFATPRLCQSRICGPVVDILEELKADHADDAAFIHMEIWRDNRTDAGYRPQVNAYGLPTEPWLFAIDARGRVTARIEGAFSLDEARDALRKALGG